MVETVYQLTVEDTLYVNVLLDSVVCIEVVFLLLTVKKSFRVYIWLQYVNNKLICVIHIIMSGFLCNEQVDQKFFY
jgi:hypothetical protein